MESGKYIVFKLEKGSYAFPINQIERILPTQEVTKVPKAPKALLGVFNLRGAVIPVLDARTRLGLKDADQSQNFIVVLSNKGRCALRVDQVTGIIALEEGSIEHDAQHLSKANDELVGAIGKNDKELIVLLDAEHLVPEDLAKKFEKVAA